MARVEDVDVEVWVAGGGFAVGWGGLVDVEVGAEGGLGGG